MPAYRRKRRSETFSSKNPTNGTQSPRRGLERTICDFIKNRSEIETELFSKTINKYVRYENKDLNKLYEYSKKMKIYEKVKEILEVVYK